MALFESTLFSDALGMETMAAVFYPGEKKRRSPTGETPVLYLYHGLSDNHTAWLRRSRIEALAEAAGIAVVMPEVQRSYYADMLYGPSYFQYVADELPAFCREVFRLSDRREDTFVAGLSMGGYGALRAALTHPERFAGAASFSGAVEAAGHMRRNPKDCMAVNGGVVRPEEDLLRLAAGISPAARPRLYLSCGLDDFLLEENERFSASLDGLGWAHTYETWEGAHEWSFWDASIEKALRFFSLIK